MDYKINSNLFEMKSINFTLEYNNKNRNIQTMKNCSNVMIHCWVKVDILYLVNGYYQR